MENFVGGTKCYEETKHRILKDDEVSFGEVLHRELHKNNT